MIKSFQSIPDVDVLLKLEPEELGVKLLFWLRQERGAFTLHNAINAFWRSFQDHNQEASFKRQKEGVDLALSEAWSWLVAQGLLVQSPDISGSSYCLSRRSKRFENEEQFHVYAAARMLQKVALHSKIATKAWMDFMRGDFDSAVLHAMKAVEVAVREASSLSDHNFGVSLMRDAFNPNDGPLVDPAMEKGEKEARSALFAGAIGAYKNPQSHRDVDLDNPIEVLEIIMLANHLLHIVDACKARNSGQHA